MFQDILPPWLLSLLLRHSNTLLASSGYLPQQGSSAHCPFSKIGQFAELHFVNSHYSSPLSAWKGIYLQGSSSKMGLNFFSIRQTEIVCITMKKGYCSHENNASRLTHFCRLNCFQPFSSFSIFHDNHRS